MIDLNSIGIGAIIGSCVVVLVNIYLHQKNIKYDRAKEQLKNLYNPLNKIINKNKKYLDFLKLREESFQKFSEEYYTFFLELREIYLDNEVYASIDLQRAFHSLLHNHELEFYNYSRNIDNTEDINKKVALFHLKHRVNENRNSEFENKLEKVIEVIFNDISKIYNNKPVKYYYK